MSILTLLILLAAAATVVSLVSGISAMAQGGEVAHRNSAQRMMWRVVFQAAALVLMILALIVH